MSDLDNPARRLHSVLAILREPEHVGLPLHKSWTAAFGLDETLTPEVLAELWRRIALIMLLPARTRAEIDLVSEDDVNHEFALRWEQPVRNTLATATNLGIQTGQATSQLTDAAMMSLEHCADILHRRRRESVVSEDDLQWLRGELNILAEEITAAQIDTELKSFLLDHVQEMTRALYDYQLRGIAAVQDAFDRTVGALSRRPDLIPDRDGPSWARRFWSIMDRSLVVLSIAGALFQLPGQVMGAIEPGQQSPPEVTVHVDVPNQPALPTAGVSAAPGS